MRSIRPAVRAGYSGHTSPVVCGPSTATRGMGFPLAEAACDGVDLAVGQARVAVAAVEGVQGSADVLLVEPRVHQPTGGADQAGVT